jgi:hypothetical protein
MLKLIFCFFVLTSLVFVSGQNSFVEPHEILMEEIEGFAGIYLDGQQTLTILIVPTNEELLQSKPFESQIIQMPNEEVQRIKDLVNRFYDPMIFRDQLNIRTAKYSLAELFDWQSRIGGVIGAQPGFVGGGIAVDLNKVVVSMLEEKYEDVFQNKLEQNGVPEDVVIFETTGEFISR